MVFEYCDQVSSTVQWEQMWFRVCVSVTGSEEVFRQSRCCHQSKDSSSEHDMAVEELSL